MTDIKEVQKGLAKSQVVLRLRPVLLLELTQGFIVDRVIRIQSLSFGNSFSSFQ